MRAEFQFGIEGWIFLEAVNKKTGYRRPLTPWFKNLITNQGKDALATQSDVMAWFHVGTSSDLPAITDTWVGAHVASSNDIESTVDGVSGSPPHYGYKRRTIRFDYGDAAGNLSEVAVGWSATTGTAFSHELIRDGVGATKTITVKPDEYLDFSYELRYIAPTSDVTGTIDISGVTYNFTTRALNVTSTFFWSQYIGNQYYEQDTNESYHRAYDGNIGLITDSVPGGNDGGSGAGTTDVAHATYLSRNYFMDFTVTAAFDDWNLPGDEIRSLVLSCRGNRWQTEFAKVSDGTGIDKTIGNSLAIDWRVSWERA